MVWKRFGTAGGSSGKGGESGGSGISRKVNTSTNTNTDPDPNPNRRASGPLKSRVPKNNTNDNEREHNHNHNAPTGTEDENTHPRTIRTVNTQPIELPDTQHTHHDTPKDDGHDEEEVVMSSTAYPGQEWKPAGLTRWEDW